MRKGRTRQTQAGQGMLKTEADLNATAAPIGEPD
jgi:hypothetical protein